jgi:hypothetical protein
MPFKKYQKDIISLVVEVKSKFIGLIFILTFYFCFLPEIQKLNVFSAFSIIFSGLSAL